MSESESESVFVVVLAGGEGTRLASLTRALYGADLPKQFAVLDGERSLLQHTIERARQLTTLDRILVVVTGHRETIAREQLLPYPGVELVVQPRNLDTAPGLLLPLARIRARTGSARVVFLPSDHHVDDVAPIIAALRESEHARKSITLIGVTPTGPEVEYGWIVRGAQVGRTNTYAVDRFAEKPDSSVADQLWRGGALWNTFISSGPVEMFWELARRHLPDHAMAFARYTAAVGGPAEREILDGAYRTMTSANFSRAILSHARSLVVAPVADTGWSDWGSPQRVFASLAGRPGHEKLVRRIRGELALAG
jgi:mannose-1-phosphate guanylyltransferase